MPQSPPMATPATLIRLSKSKIAAFEQCPRRLWLQVHRRELAQFDEATLARFQCGHFIGELARLRYPEGQLVPEDHTQVPAALERTKALLNAEIQRTIFEAAFEHEGVIIRADILEPDGWGGWQLTEVKNAGTVQSYQIRDVATQAWVIGGNQICVSAIRIRHVARPLRTTSRNPAVRFVDTDVTLSARRIAAGRKTVIDKARSMLAGHEPMIQPSRHCERPSCEFRHHCTGLQPSTCRDRAS